VAFALHDTNTVYRLVLILPLVAGCVFFDASSRVAGTIEDRAERYDIRILEPGPMAVGAVLEIDVEHINLPTTPGIESGETTGPFEVIETGVGSLTVHALGPGVGTVEPTSDEGKSATLSLVAHDPDRMTIRPSCAGRDFVAPGGRFAIGYDLFAGDVELEGHLDPIVTGPVTSAGRGSGTFLAPEDFGVFEVSSALTPSSSFELTVYDPEAITLEVSANAIGIGYPRSVTLEASQLVEGQPVCVPVTTDYEWRTETPSVCSVRYGTDDVDVATSNDTMWVRVHQPGRCSIRVHTVSPLSPDGIYDWDFEPS